MTVGALSPIHQFCRVGKYAYIGGGTVVTQDVLPFSLTSATREAHAYGMNKVGLERRGFDRATAAGAASCVPDAAGFETEYGSGGGEAARGG